MMKPVCNLTSKLGVQLMEGVKQIFDEIEAHEGETVLEKSARIGEQQRTKRNGLHFVLSIDCPSYELPRRTLLEGNAEKKGWGAFCSLLLYAGNSSQAKVLLAAGAEVAATPRIRLVEALQQTHGDTAAPKLVQRVLNEAAASGRKK